MAIIRTKVRKHDFPWKIKRLADFRVRRIIVVSVPLLGSLLKQWIVNALRNQEDHRFFEIGNDVPNLFILAIG
ncbi:MAG: hypothetical protein ACFFD2_07870 [Promethearchaeota archaeon]